MLQYLSTRILLCVINSDVTFQGNELGETLSRHSTELKLPQHHSSHRDVIPYTELMIWLKQSDRASFKELTKVNNSTFFFKNK